MTNFKRSLTLSLVLHVSPLLLMLFLTGGGSGDGGRSGDNSQIIPKLAKDEPVEIEIVKTDGFIQKKKPVVPHEKDSCKDFFGGIGIETRLQITHGGYSNAINKVYSNYPADISGLQVGDIIVSNNDIRGEVGTEVSLIILRDGANMQVKMIRDKICIEKPIKETEVGP